MTNKPLVFRFVGYGYDEATRAVSLRYAFDGGPHFEETFVFHDAPSLSSPAQRNALDTCLRHLHLAAGVSYYKAFPPAAIAIDAGPLSSSEAAFFEKLYTFGLGEFAYRNGVDLRGKIHFPRDASVAPQPAVYGLTRRALVPVGGGKDSIVTVEALKRAGEDVLLFYMGNAQPILETVATAGLPAASVQRTICPNLIRLNAQGALNGHVPVTGILSFVLAAAAVLYGCDAIVMSNERSANVGNLVTEGLEINHQYSKSFEFERDFAEHLENRVLPGLSYFSLLRPLSELAIAGLFARLTQYHAVFVSCNGAFKLDPTRRTRWCCSCPKCRFVFLVLAPFLERTALVAIFGADLLDDPAHLAGFREILGLEGHKPFECVGEEEESRAALCALRGRSDWLGASMLEQLIYEVAARYGCPDEGVAAFLQPSNEHDLPPRFFRALDEFRRAQG